METEQNVTNEELTTENGRIRTTMDAGPRAMIAHAIDELREADEAQDDFDSTVEVIDALGAISRILEGTDLRLVQRAISTWREKMDRRGIPASAVQQALLAPLTVERPLFDLAGIPRAVLVAPCFSGKSSAAKSNSNVIDPDVAQDPTDAQLRELRRANDWNAHNAIWFPKLAQTLRPLIGPKSIVMFHDFTTAEALGMHVTGTWMPDAPEFWRRVADYVTTPDSTRPFASRYERARLGVLNREGVAREAGQRGYRVYSTFEEALEASDGLSERRKAGQR